MTALLINFPMLVAWLSDIIRTKHNIFEEVQRQIFRPEYSKVCHRISNHIGGIRIFISEIIAG